MNNLREKIKAHIDGVDGTVGLYIKHLGSGEELVINQDERFHAASIIKIPILWEALRQVDVGDKSLQDKIPLRKEEKVGGCGVLSLLHDGIEVTLEDLLHLMIDVSDNTATNMLIDYLGKDHINTTLKQLDMHNTYLARKLMVVLPGTYSYTTPKDIGNMLEGFVAYKGLSKESAEKALEILDKQQLNDCFSKELNLCGACGNRVGHNNLCSGCQSSMSEVDAIPVKFPHKTGEIVGVVHDAGIMDIDGEKIVLVGLTKQLKNNHIGHQLLSNIGVEVYKYFKR
ncbi:MAG: serine hydrolase [Clostridiaceae bacterium]|nr:serine hydrolase [Clostridiaceae bacterium]